MSGEIFSSTSNSSSSKLMFEHNFSSPYYMNSSNNEGSILVSYLLKGENYPTWRHAMMNTLLAKNKLCFVDGSLPQPIENNQETYAWEKHNSMVIYWISNALALEVHDSVTYVGTTYEMWGDL